MVRINCADHMVGQKDPHSSPRVAAPDQRSKADMAGLEPCQMHTMADCAQSRLCMEQTVSLHNQGDFNPQSLQSSLESV